MMPPDPPTPEEFEKERENNEETDETQTMTEDKNADTAEASGIREEITTIRGSGALENMKAQHTGGNKWTVLSARSGSVDAYRVDTTEPSCTCEHADYNGENSEACGHIIYAMLEGERTVPEEAYQSARVHQAVDKLRDVSGDVEALHAAMDETRVEQLSNTPDSPDNNDATADPPTPEEAYQGTARGEAMDAAPDADEEAEKLKAAFDEVVEDMQVETNAGKVWFQTGRDTPDDWPFPGVDSTFNAVTGAEVVEFVYESDDGPNHEWYDDKPGEWFKNALEPRQVDEYISEVLE